MSQIRSLVCLIVIVLGTQIVCLSGDKPKLSSLPKIPMAIHDALQSQDFETATKLINAALKQDKVTASDYLLYLKGRAQTEAKSLDLAIETFKDLENRFPKSRWIARAKFGRADVLVRQKNYRAAGLIYQAAAKRLLSSGRKDELAGIYLEFADRYFDGIADKDPSGKKHPDYKQALEYYRQALDLGPSLGRRQRVELRIARCHQELKQMSQAIQAYQYFLTRYTDHDSAAGEILESRTPKETVDAQLEIEARYQLGLAQLADGQLAEARKTWQDFLASETGLKAGGDLLAQAAYRIAHTYRVPAPRTTGDLELGVAALEKFLKDYSKHKLAAQAEFEIANSYSHNGRHDEAVARLKKLIGNADYDEARQIAQARNLLGQVLVAQRKYTEAIGAWREFLDRHPTDRNWSQVQRKIIDTEYAMAAQERNDKNYVKARTLWETFLNKYPLDLRVPHILYHFGTMKYLEAVELRNKSKLKNAKAAVAKVADTNSKKLFQEAIRDWQRLASKFPNDSWAHTASYMIGVILEDQLGQLKDALEAYKKVQGTTAGLAKQRIAVLTAKQLEVVTERKFRSNESPTIKVTTRNLESVTIKLYRIDMTDYFRKLHLATGIESLDIALIDPDKTIEHKIDDYQEYRRQENEITIPVTSHGVTAVTVSSDKLECTTMVIVSDIDVIVKSSRSELFVYAQNMRTGKPAAGVSLLISDGKEIFGEELTNQQGVLQKSYDNLKTVTDLRVFAVKEGHAASTLNSLSGLQFAVGLAPKGYLYTDRPAYRSGQVVQLKGIIRWVNNDQYTFKAGEKFQLDVYDSRGRVIHTNNKLTLNKFGTLADRFALPDGAAQGQYRVHVHQARSNQSYESVFQVLEYKLEPVQISVDLPRRVYYRGETIEGRIALKYYYGTPLTGKTIQYRLADGRVHTGTTNGKGEIEFKFPTRRFSESQALSLAVNYGERNLNLTETIYLATRGFAIGVSTLRDVYIAGETFDASVKVLDPANKPVAADLKLEVFLRTITDGRRSERSIFKHEIKSDDKQGEARDTIHIDLAGIYILRATGIDRFGNPVSGERVIRISGDDDQVRLRILADQHRYQVGDQARVQLHWREDPALALVTYEGASILGYKLIELKRGANALTIRIESKLAPNFQLCVCVMQQNRFHKSFSEFLVTRRLSITLKTNKTSLSPGENLTVEITTTDAQGKPISAELSLGLVQENLLQMFGERTGVINEFLGGGYRRPAVRVASSCTFSYRPTTRGISQFLVAEAERRKMRYREEQDLADFVDEFNQLMKQHRYAEAEIVAKKAKDIAPDQPVTEVMKWKSRIARRTAFNEDLKDRKEQGFIDQLNSVEQSAIGFDDSMPIASPDDWQDITIRRKWSSGTRDTNGHPLRERISQIEIERMRGFSEEKTEKVFGPLRSANKSGPWESANGFGPYATTNGRREGKSAVAGGLAGYDTQFTTDMRWEYANQSGLQRDPSTGAWISLRSSMGVYWDESQNQKTHQLRRDLLNKKVDYNLANVKLGDALQRLAEDVNGNIVIDGLALQDNRVSLSSMRALNARGQSVGTTLKQLLDDYDLAMLVRDDVLTITNRARLPLVVRSSQGETGFWNPVVVTNSKGKATLTIPLPDRTTVWKLRSKGIDTDALSGEAEVQITAKKDLFGDLKTPLAFTAGDKASVLVEVHNSIIKKGQPIVVRFKTTIGEKSTEVKRIFRSTGPGIKELTFPIDLTDGDVVAFELFISAGEHSDTQVRAVQIRPYGMPVFANVSGTSAQSTIAFVRHAKGLAVEKPQLEIIIGPDINRSLLDSVLGGAATMYELSCYGSQGNGLERAISDTLGGIALLRMIGQSKSSNSPELQALAGRVQSSVSQLVSSQRDDGGWSWSGRSQMQSDRFTTSRVVWALSAARASGFAVPNNTINKAVQSLKSAFASSGQSDREGQAILLHGLAEAGAADFAFANRLYRERNNLSASGLLHLALTLTRLNRKEMASELLPLVKLSLDKRNIGSRAVDVADTRLIPWMRNGVELRALYLLALSELKATNKKLSECADWLMAARVGTRWRTEKSNGPAIAALAGWFARAKNVNEKYSLSVYVNDNLVKKLEIDAANDPSRHLKIPEKFLKKGEAQRINFDIEGRGRFSYSVVLSGFVPADRLKKTTDSWRVTRSYEPAQRMLDGQVIPRGFGNVTNHKPFFNPLTQIPLGERGEVTLAVSRYLPFSLTPKSVEYLVMTEPVPAGTMVLTESIKGSFQRYEITPGAITFYLGDNKYPGIIQYTLVGYLPGRFRVIPTVVRDFYDPSQIAVSQIKSLDVLNRGETSDDKYKLSPVELFEYGKRTLVKGQHARANKYLSDLFKNYRLKRSVYGEVVLMLFKTALASGNHAEIVEYFEFIKEGDWDIEIGLDLILKVAAAYQELGEYERSFLVFRATIEGSFERENQIAGFLDKRNEFVRAIEVMERLLHEYPAESYVGTATFALAGEVQTKAASARSNKKLRDADITRVDLIDTAISMYDHMLSTWPLDPAADQASFALANALLDLKQFQPAIQRCEKFAERYPKSKLLDSFWYVIGYSHFALGEHEQALEMCKRVSEAKRTEPRTGIELEAANKWQAIYIMGQVYHSLGKPAEAIDEYKRVKSRFADAAEAIDFFTRKDIRLPEVTTVKPGKATKVELKFRNVSDANIKVYRIDLLKFSLMQRNLDRITAINLAGIRPYHELNQRLGDGLDYGDRKQELTLPLTDEGAYLVVCRGENLYTSGLVLVTPLQLEVQEDATTGRVRVTVKDSIKGTYNRDVHVKVIGSMNQKFTDGNTDLRGIFVADSITGTSTIIAKAGDNRYAFYRGKTSLGKVAVPDKSKQVAAPQKPARRPSNGKSILLKNLDGSNSDILMEQRDNYRSLLDNDARGVKAKAAF